MDHLTEAEKQYLEEVAKQGQESVIATLTTEDQLRNFIHDLQYVDSFYPGGYKAYLTKAKQLLHDASMKINPLQGWTPSVPQTISMEFGTKEFYNSELYGLQILQQSGFVLVAGGLGERLGYNGIKVSLPVETLTMTSYLEFYIRKILSYQHRIPSDQSHRIPLAIMTSDSNHALTLQFLEEHNYFGMDRDQVFLMKQDVVPSVVDPACHLAVLPDGHLLRKPHGHGDVHLCLYRDGIVAKWIKEFGVKRLVFFQDTNALAFYSMPCTAAIADAAHAHMVTTSVRRRPHEASGALCQLKHVNGEQMVCNVEYNQLEDFLRSVDPRGDYADEGGFSPFPGNSNILSFDAQSYLDLLSKSHGIVPEFVNPKMKPGSTTEYAQPVRLESMMQDYPKLMLAHGIANKTHQIVVYPRFMTWSPVKNSPARAKELRKKTGHEESPRSGEADQLELYRRLLLSRNDCPMCNPERKQCVTIEEGAMVVLDPESGCVTEEIHRHLGEGVVLKAGSVLIVKSRQWYLEKTVIDGCLVIEERGAVVKESTVKNEGWRFKEIDENDETIPVVIRMRGYVVEKKEKCLLNGAKITGSYLGGETAIM